MALNNKEFVRFLKEIGVWSNYKKHRRLFLGNINQLYKINLIPNATTISGCIGNSFSWARTDHPNLWYNIVDYFERHKKINKLSCTEAIKRIMDDELCLIVLKHIVEKHTRENNG